MCPCGCFIIVIEKYQFRDEKEKGRFVSPDIKDFKRLNKAVLGQKATNAAVSNQKLHGAFLQSIALNFC